jgi:hypothetical protein
MVAMAGGKSGGSGEEVAAELAGLSVGYCEVAVEALKFSVFREEVWEVKGED